MTRNFAMAGLLGAAVGGPYLVSQAPPDWSAGWDPNGPSSTVATQPVVDPRFLRPPGAEAPHGPGSEIYRRPAPFEGRVQRSLDEILRWEITKDWVFSSWDRKSTGLADPELFGVRVPVVTGRSMADVAGALSYYFDAAGTLQRIRMVGTTADTNGIARLVTQRFGMQRRVSSSAGEQLYQSQEGERVRSELRTRPEPVLWGTSPHNSFRIQLELNRPGGSRWVQPPTLDLASINNEANGQALAEKPQAEPFLPPRSVIPDQEAEAKANNALTPPVADQAAAPQSATVPAVEPETNIKPLDSYRSRFRWPD